jgi:hypothetical protein
MKTITELKGCFYAVQQIENMKRANKDVYTTIHQYFVELETLRKLATKYAGSLPDWKDRIACAHFRRAGIRLHRIQRAGDLH